MPCTHNRREVQEPTKVKRRVYAQSSVVEYHQHVAPRRVSVHIAHNLVRRADSRRQAKHINCIQV